MKILHLIDEPWDSGITAYALQIAALLRDGGDEVVVGLRKGRKPDEAANRLGLATASFDTLKDRRELMDKPWDVINAHTGSTHTWAMVLSNRWRGAAASPVVIRTRGDARELRVNPLSRFLYRVTDGAIAASTHIGRQYEAELQLAENRLRIIYPGIAAGKTPAEAPTDVIGMLGRLDEVKGHATFLEAAAFVLRARPQTRFLVAGREAGIPAELLRNQARALGVESVVSFLGNVPSARDFMEHCAIGVIASNGSEEISRVCLEWMASARPVVATMVGCLPELIDSDENGLLVPPKNGEALGQALLRLLDDRNASLRLGRNGRERVLAHYSSERMLRETRTFYLECLAARGK